jgi:hypothetical protein
MRHAHTFVLYPCVVTSVFRVPAPHVRQIHPSSTHERVLLRCTHMHTCEHVCKTQKPSRCARRGTASILTTRANITMYVAELMYTHSRACRASRGRMGTHTRDTARGSFGSRAAADAGAEQGRVGPGLLHRVTQCPARNHHGLLCSGVAPVTLSHT